MALNTHRFGIHQFKHKLKIFKKVPKSSKNENLNVYLMATIYKAFTISILSNLEIICW